VKIPANIDLSKIGHKSEVWAIFGIHKTAAPIVIGMPKIRLKTRESRRLT